MDTGAINSRAYSILLVEDSASQAAAYTAYLLNDPYRVDHVTSGEAALEYLVRNDPGVIVLDLGLPGIGGLEVLKQLRRENVSSSVIIITDNDSVDIAVEAMRSGADDYLAKPFSAERLKITVRNATERQELVKLLQSYRQTIDGQRFHGMIGRSQKMLDVYETILNVGPSTASVFITGESGTGKELCAHAVHAESNRKDGPFIALNCAAIPRELMESEIFGHEKGAFTGADGSRDGAAILADGGTLFLDEICDMDLDLQAKLLRFIQAGTFQKVGSSETLRVDIRFIAATNKDPLEEITRGRFREDLYYRLHVIPIVLPPLRERRGDMLLMAYRFLERFCSDDGKNFRQFTPRAEELLENYAWPGNVRELENAVRNIVVLNSGETVTPQMLPDRLSERVPDNAAMLEESDAQPTEFGVLPMSELELEPLHVIERRHIELGIAACDGNISKAAVLLGVNPSTLYRKRRSWPSDF